MNQLFSFRSAVSLFSAGLFSVSLMCSLTQAQDLATGIVLKRVEVSGATVFSQVEINNALANVEGQTVYIEDILAMVDRLTGLYVDAGYITSGAVLPDQDVSDGIVRIDIVEGDLAQISLTTSGRLNTGYLESKLRQGLAAPLNLQDLQRSFSRLEQERIVNHVRGELKPGKQPGESHLVLAVIEEKAWTIRLGADNYRSPSVGDEQTSLAAEHLNLLGFNDALNLGLQHTNGIDSGYVRYEFPITGIKSRLAVYHSSGETLVVEAPFDVIDLESETDTTGLTLTTAWRDDARLRVSTGISYEVKESQTRLLGLPFDFAAGSREGLAEASVIGAFLEYTFKGQSSGFALRGGVRLGSDENDVPFRVAGEDGDFSLYQVQADYIVRLGSNSAGRPWLFGLSMNYQGTSDTLPAFERMALGGHGSIRGYRENRLLMDSGVAASAELTIPLLRQGADSDLNLNGLLFADYGRGENSTEANNVSTDNAISSIGLGFNGDYRGFRFSLIRAIRFQNKQKLGETLQDSGIHVGVTYEF